MGSQQLADNLQILDFVDSNEDDRQIAGDSLGPKDRGTGSIPLEDFRGRPQRRVGIEHPIGETLEQMRLVGRNAEMSELHLGLRPRARDCALVSGCVEMLVDQVEHFAARRRNQRPKRDAHRGLGRDPHATAKAEDRIQYGAHCAGERLAFRYADWRPDPAAPSDETRSVGLILRIAHGVALNDREMGSPDFRFARRPPAPGGQEGADIGHEFRLHEQLGEGGMRPVGLVRGQHDLRIGRQLDLPGLVPVV